MSKVTDENIPIRKNIINSKNSKNSNNFKIHRKPTSSIFKKPSRNEYFTLNSSTTTSVLMREITKPKIVKIENSNNCKCNEYNATIKIEFSKDKSLVDRLFSLKESLVIKRKTSI